MTLHLTSCSFVERDSPLVHIMSAASAGFVSSTATNPIWFVKTRMQLDYNSKVQMTVRQCIERVYAQGGLAAFYKGITASYFGICETMIHFVIYEFIKSKLVSCAYTCFIQPKLKHTHTHYSWSSAINDIRTQRAHATSWNSWWLVPCPRQLLPALRIHTKWHERVCVRRATNITRFGRRCTPCGRRRVAPGCIGGCSTLGL